MSTHAINERRTQKYPSINRDSVDYDRYIERKFEKDVGAPGVLPWERTADASLSSTLKGMPLGSTATREVNPKGLQHVPEHEYELEAKNDFFSGKWAPKYKLLGKEEASDAGTAAGGGTARAGK